MVLWLRGGGMGGIFVVVVGERYGGGSDGIFFFFPFISLLTLNLCM